MPHLDTADIATRAYAAEQARKARLVEQDRAENAARIREQVEPDPPPGGCRSCGDPYAKLDDDGECSICRRDNALLDFGRERMSPEELYPEHFPDDGEDEE